MYWSSFMTSSMQLAKECLSQKLTDEQGEGSQPFEGLEKFAETIETGMNSLLRSEWMSQVINLCCNSVLQNVISFTVTGLAYLHLFTVKLKQEGRRGEKKKTTDILTKICVHPFSGQNEPFFRAKLTFVYTRARPGKSLLHWMIGEVPCCQRWCFWRKYNNFSTIFIENWLVMTHFSVITLCC